MITLQAPISWSWSVVSKPCFKIIWRCRKKWAHYNLPNGCHVLKNMSDFLTFSQSFILKCFLMYFILIGTPRTVSMVVSIMTLGRRQTTFPKSSYFDNSYIYKYIPLKFAVHIEHIYVHHLFRLYSSIMIFVFSMNFQNNGNWSQRSDRPNKTLLNWRHHVLYKIAPSSIL